MSWLSEAWDGVSGFVKENKDWLKPAIGAGVGVFNQSVQDDTRGQYIDYLKQKEQENWAAGKAAYDAQLAAAQSGGGGSSRSGGGGDGGAAARAPEANRQAAAKKADKQEQKTYAEALKLYAPFVQTTQELLPAMANTYKGSLSLMDLLNGQVRQPAAMAKLSTDLPAFKVKVPLSEKERGY
jgi:hypothetical protein